MWSAVLDLFASALPTVLGWFGVGKAQDSPSPDFTSGEALGASQQAQKDTGGVINDLDKARAVERAADSDRLRGTADPRGPDKYRRD